MKIKVGDKVRVSKDAPKMYYPKEEDGIVMEIEGEDALIKSESSGMPHCSPFWVLAIPTKYLVKVDAEAKEPKFKVGDKVVRKNVSTVRTITGIESVSDETGTSYYYDTVDSQGNNPMDFLESELILYIESTPKCKKGDRVRSKGYGLEAVVLGVDGDYIAVRRDDGIKQEWKRYMTELVEPTEQTEAEKKPYDGISEETANEISNMLEAYAKALSGIADSFDWQRYEADLAKEVALKVANKYNDPEQAAEYAVSVAKSIVEGLKRK